jgi:transcriptional regulator with XRE-family HTH domain
MVAGSNKNQDYQYTGEMLMKLAARLKTLRKQRGFASAENFANAYNINRTQYGRYEKGEDIRFSSLVRLLKAIGISLSEFFSEGFDN